MTQILVPGVCQAALRGTVSGHTFACIFHYSFNTPGTNWTTAQLNTLSDALMGSIASTNGVASLSGTNVIFSQVVAVDLGTTTPASGASSHAPIVGTSIADLPPSVCVLVDNLINARYRGGHPRTYMPPMGTNQLAGTEDQWTSGAVGSYETAFTNMHDAAFSAVPGIHQCAVRYNYTVTDDTVKHKYVRTRSSLNSVPPVSSYLVKAQLGTQRRRLRTGG